MFDRCADVFSAVKPGGRIGIIANGDLTTPISKLAGDMMVWSVEEHGVSVQYEPVNLRCSGGASTDIVFIVDDETLAMLLGASGDNLANRLAARSKRGKMMLYFMIGRDDLEDGGYFDFLEMVGLSFLGPCR